MNKSYWFDLLERTARTFVQGFLAVVTLDAFSDFNATYLQMLLVGALSGVYAVLTSFAAKSVGNSKSASLIE